MATQAKAAEYASHFPHVTKVWVKGGEFFLHPVPGAELIHEAGMGQPKVETKVEKKLKSKDNGN